MNTANAVMAQLSNPTPYVGIVLAALAAATGAVQIGIIASQKEPTFAKGGMVKLAGGGLINGAGTGTSDSINARVSNGESIINSRSTQAFMPLLSAINQLGGGVSFNGQPTIQKNPEGVVPNMVSQQQSETNISVSISEAEISTVQGKIAKINMRSTF